MGYIHRDLKPANILMGTGKKESTVYLIDFGLTKKKNDVTYSSFTTQAMGNKKMAGTPIYASINAHMATGGNPIHKFTECNKRDDLESLMYVLI